MDINACLVSIHCLSYKDTSVLCRLVLGLYPFSHWYSTGLLRQATCDSLYLT